MGYRSQVRALIYGDPDKLNAMIVKHQLEGGEIFSSFAGSLTRYKAMRIVYDVEASAATVDPSTGKGTAVWADVEVEVLDLSGDDWKWYPNYEDVQAWMVFMRSAGEFGCSWEFVRIGEEQGDIECESNVLDDGEHWLSVTSSITNDVESRGKVETFVKEANNG
jgi:hypothetical protein